MRRAVALVAIVAFAVPRCTHWCVIRGMRAVAAAL
jgi:hypothetical protein